MATYKPTNMYSGPIHTYSVEDPDLSFYNHELHKHLLANSWAFCKNSLIFLESYAPVVVAKLKRVKVPRVVANWSGVHITEVSHVYSIQLTDNFEKLSNPSKKTVTTLLSKMKEPTSDFMLTANVHTARTITRPSATAVLAAWRAGTAPIRLSGPYDLGVSSTLDLTKWILPREIPEAADAAVSFINQFRLNRNSLQRMESMGLEADRAELTRLLENLPNE